MIWDSTKSILQSQKPTVSVLWAVKFSGQSSFLTLQHKEKARAATLWEGTMKSGTWVVGVRLTNAVETLESQVGTEDSTISKLGLQISEDAQG